MPRRSPYSALFALPGVARLFAIAFLARLPQAMTGVVLTLHVVTTLHRGYGEAGLVTAVMTVGMAVGSPWRGRLVDRLGLRRAVAPSVAVASGYDMVRGYRATLTTSRCGRAARVRRRSAATMVAIHPL